MASILLRHSALSENLVLPRPEMYLIADPVTRKMSVILKLKLWLGVSIMGSFWLNENLRPAFGVQVVTAMSEKMAYTSPAHPWRLF